MYRFESSACEIRQTDGQIASLLNEVHILMAEHSNRREVNCGHSVIITDAGCIAVGEG